jgi:hypothetical protein
MKMTRTVFAIAIATLMLFAVSGTSQAVPIAPPTGVTSSDISAVTPVYWYRHHYYYRHHYRRHCWRGRYHWHCY